MWRGIIRLPEGIIIDQEVISIDHHPGDVTGEENDDDAHQDKAKFDFPSDVASWS